MRWRQPCTRSSVRLFCRMMRGHCELSVRNTHGCNSTPWWLSSLKKARANWGCSIISFVGGSEFKSTSRGGFSFVGLHFTCISMSESLVSRCEISEYGNLRAALFCLNYRLLYFIEVSGWFGRWLLLSLTWFWISFVPPLLYLEFN